MQYKQQLRILHWNAQGISTLSIQVQLEELLERKLIDICLLNETFLKDHHKMNMKNFKIYRNDRDSFAGGVAILVRNSIDHILLPIQRTDKIENISIQLIIQQRPIIFTSAYSPSYGNNFSNDIMQLCPVNKEFLIFGDFNAKHTSWRCTKNNRAGKVLFDLQNTQDWFIHTTPNATYFPHQHNRSPSTIDFLLTNTSMNLTDFYTLDNEISSDHIPIFCNLYCTNITEYKRIFHDYKNANWNTYRSHIDRATTNDQILNCPRRVDSEIDKTIHSFIQARDAAIPTKLENTHFQIDDATSEAITHRNCIRRLYQRASTPEKPQLKLILNQLNRLIKRRIIATRNNKWNNLLKNMKPGDKKFWAASKNLRGKTNSFTTKLIVNNTTVITPEEKANALADEFQKSHQLTSHMRNPIDRKVKQSVTKLKNIQQFPIENAITSQEVSTIIKGLKPSKSPGLDNISNRLLKNLPPKAIQKLTDIFNACLKLGYFPETFKTVKVIPVAKPGKNVKLPSSYRPISLLSSIGKIFEKLILNRILRHAEANNIIPPEQFGFRTQHSTTHQTKRIASIIKTNKRLRQSTGLILFDIEKAFDSVWHDGLVHKLVSYNFPTHICKCINSFLSNRTYQVSIDGHLSNSKPIPAGVPQGSVLSPLLYTIFTSDYKAPRNVQVAYYADDTAIIIKSKVTKSLIKKMERAMTSHMKYFEKWRIQINACKTQAIIFPYSKSPRLNPKRKLKIGDAEIEFSKSVTYLGVTFDDKLNFREHIMKTLSKATKAFRSLYPLLCRRSYLSTQNKSLIYKCIIRAIILYACPIWKQAAWTHILNLQILQNKILKLIYNLPRLYPTRRLHDDTGYPLVPDLLNQHHNRFINSCRLSEFALIEALGLEG